MRCPVCNKGFEDNLIHCPYCKTDPRRPEPEVSPELVSAVWRKQIKALFTVGGMITFVIGGSIIGLYSTVKDEIERRVVQKVAAEFEQPRIRETVTSVATSEASAILKNSVQPAITTFQGAIDKRLTDFDGFVTEQKNATLAAYETLRREVETLQRRNRLTALADAAISDGVIEAFRELERICEPEAKGDEYRAAMAELFRVYAAYSIGAPTRWPDLELLASKINPLKQKESELTIDELLTILELRDPPQARARALDLLAKKEIKKSPVVAKALVEALKRETHLEVVRRIRATFALVTEYRKGGKLDGRDLLEWWEANKAEFSKSSDTTIP